MLRMATAMKSRRKLHSETCSRWDSAEGSCHARRRWLFSVSIDIELALFNADRGRNIPQALDLAGNEWRSRKSVRVADVYAWVLYRAGRYEEAREMISQALRLGTRDPLILHHAEAIAHAGR